MYYFENNNLILCIYYYLLFNDMILLGKVLPIKCNKNNRLSK